MLSLEFFLAYGGKTDERAARPLWARLMRDLEASPLAARYTEDELFKMIFVIIEMLGSVCYSSIIEGKPDTVDNMKPVLYGIVRKILS